MRVASGFSRTGRRRVLPWRRTCAAIVATARRQAWSSAAIRPASGSSVLKCKVPVAGSPSSRGLGRGPFKAKTRVRIPLGTYHLSDSVLALAAGTTAWTLAARSAYRDGRQAHDCGRRPPAVRGEARAGRLAAESPSALAVSEGCSPPFAASRKGRAARHPRGTLWRPALRNS
jgi:hypothetical protein